MAIVQNTYTGNGSTTLYSLSFLYLDKTDVKVTLNEVPTTAFIFVNESTIQFTTAPGAGVTIRIYRETDDTAPVSVFSPGSSIKADDLNEGFEQILYVAQETSNNSVAKYEPEVFDNLDFNGFKGINVANPTNPQDTATKDYVDQRYGDTTIPGHTRWRKSATAGQTTFSGTGDYGGVLAYSSPREQVFVNGALQQRSADYAADNGTSIIFNVGLIAGDVVDIVCVNNLTDSTISNAGNINYGGQFAGQTTRTVSAKLADVVSVKDFGAVGDGIADDTVAIQAAINSGKAAYVPKGTYKITATLNLFNGYKALIGSEDLPVILKTTSGPAIKIGTTAGAVLNEYSRVENLYLQTFVAATFPASPGPNDAGVVLDGSSSSLAAAVQNARVFNVRVGNWSCGFYTNDVVGCRIEGCFVQLLQDSSTLPGFTASNKFCGFVLDATPFVTGGISPQASIELVDNDVTGVGTPNNLTSVGYYIIGSDIRDVFFDRCETASTSYGYWVNTSGSDFHWDVQIRRPIIDAFKKHGIFIENVTGPGSITIDGGYLVGTGISAGASIYATNSNGISVTGGTQILGLANNNATDDGIRFDSCNSCLVVGNNFINLNYGVSINNSKNCTITGNYFYAAATDTEPSPALFDAIRVFGGSEENSIVGNVIKGKDTTDKYDTGVVIASGCPRNVVVGNSIDGTSVTTPYSIGDGTTTLVSSDALQISSNTVQLKSNNAALLLQGNNGTYPIQFLDGGGNVISKINNSGVYSTGAP
jgi:parallel beta-helix repeat protein